MSKISNVEDVIDSRDVIERLKELEEELEAAYQAEADADVVEFEEWVEGVAENAAAAMHDEAEEFLALRDFAAEAEGATSDWQYGATLIRDSYFPEYAEELLKDCGDLPDNIPWYIVIDWEATAANVQQDYTAVEFGGVTYWTR